MPPSPQTRNVRVKFFGNFADRLRAKNEQLQQDFEKLEKDVQEELSSLQKIHGELSRHDEHLDLATKELCEMEIKVKEAEEQLKGLKREKDALDMKLIEVKRECETMDSDKQHAIMDTNLIRKKCLEKKKILEEHEKIVEEMENKLQNYKNICDEMEKSKSILQKRLALFMTN
ncbi:11158_t:CDS:2 [Entrophospora sp. SA101]|nr:11158_t:CDS:2 [Entrophospora sp. SA101]